MTINEPRHQPAFLHTRRAIQRRSFTHGLSLREWVGTIQAADHVLQDANIDDGAITAARRMSLNMQPVSSDIVAAMLGEAEDARASKAATQLHELVSIATHLVRRDAALTPELHVLITNLTRDLDGHPRLSHGLTEALSNWGHTIFELAPHLDTRQERSVARWQRALMAAALSARSDIEAPEQQPLDRLWPAIEAERDRWAAVASHLGKRIEDPRSRPDVHCDSAARALFLAANQLSAAVRGEPSPARLLDACIRTDFANNLVTAYQFNINHLERRDTAFQLHQLSALTHPPMVRELPPPLHIQRPPYPTQETQAQEPERAACPPRQPPAPTLDPLTREEAASYARQRGAGIIAQAALDGSIEAKSVTLQATTTELSSIAEAGRSAVAHLAASVYPWAQQLYGNLVRAITPSETPGQAS